MRKNIRCVWNIRRYIKYKKVYQLKFYEYVWNLRDYINFMRMCEIYVDMCNIYEGIWNIRGIWNIWRYMKCIEYVWLYEFMKYMKYDIHESIWNVCGYVKYEDICNSISVITEESLTMAWLTVVNLILECGTMLWCSEILWMKVKPT